MGARSRTYGHDHERWVAQQYRKKWPRATVRRSLQAHSAAEPDVVVEGEEAPAIARRIWSECCTAEAVAPLKKLAQAERDSIDRPHGTGSDWLPVVVWRKKGERTVRATMRHETLVVLGGGEVVGNLYEADYLLWCMPVTVDFADLLEAMPS